MYAFARAAFRPRSALALAPSFDGARLRLYCHCFILRYIARSSFCVARSCRSVTAMNAMLMTRSTATPNA